MPAAAGSTQCGSKVRVPIVARVFVFHDAAHRTNTPTKTPHPQSHVNTHNALRARAPGRHAADTEEAG